MALVDAPSLASCSDSSLRITLQPESTTPVPYPPRHIDFASDLDESFDHVELSSYLDGLHIEGIDVLNTLDSMTAFSIPLHDNDMCHSVGANPYSLPPNGQATCLTRGSSNDRLLEDGIPFRKWMKALHRRARHPATERSLQRRRILEELISTEEGYIGDVRFLMNVYVTLLASLPTLPLGMRSSINRNLTDIIQLHEEILSDLHRVVPDSEYALPDFPRPPAASTGQGHRRWRSLDAVPEHHHPAPWIREAPSIGSEAQIAGDVARVFSRKMNQFFIYEEYGAKYEMMIKDVASTQRKMPHWEDYQKGLEALASSLGPVNSRFDQSRKSLTIGDLLVKPIQRMCKADQIYTIEACISLNGIKVEEPDNGRGLQCHTAPFSWKIVFECDSQLYEMVMTACNPREQDEWRGRLEQSAKECQEQSDPNLLYSSMSLDIRSLGTVFGKPGRSRSENLVRSSASTMMRKLSVTSITSSFTKRSNSVVSMTKLIGEDEAVDVLEMRRPVSKLSRVSRSWTEQDGDLHAGPTCGAILHRIRDESEKKDPGNTPTGAALVPTPIEVLGQGSAEAQHHDEDVVMKDIGRKDIKMLQDSPTGGRSVRKGTRREEPCSMAAKRAAKKAKLAHGAGPSLWGKVGVLNRDVMIQGIRSFFR
ncbi:hypothetical protein HYQ45_009287 [Verticillium longisporum]|uniref:DH domain-containing protein n=1 Tax=Verticillium longisporum TaxID=100787 RepID=A0A8I2ZIC4_VERLO|nr:hypothetical protein HYQ45_009287 [Verticillium longisporum]